MSVLKLAPNFAQKSEVLYKLAVIFGKTYQIEQALNYFKLAILESGGSTPLPRRIDILIKIGICYIEIKQYTEALKSFETALSYNDQNPRAWLHVAWCEHLLGRDYPALEHAGKAIALHDNESEGYYIQGRVFLATEKLSEAKEAINKAILRCQNKAVYFASLGHVNCLSKLYSDAFDNYLKATQIDPTLPEVWFNIGLLYEIHQQYNEASIAYQRALDAAPDFTEAATRKQLIATEQASGVPLPSPVHPKFCIPDTMVPLKSFLNNLKVKKASDPSVPIQQTPVQPSNPIVSPLHQAHRRPYSVTSISPAALLPALQPLLMDRCLRRLEKVYEQVGWVESAWIT